MAIVNVMLRGRIYEYNVNAPYIFASGKMEKRSVESLMFSDRSYLMHLKRISDMKMLPESKPNRLHLHLGWILEAGEFVRTNIKCRFCTGKDERNVKFFSIRRSYSGECSYGHDYMSCEDQDCKSMIREERSFLADLKFSAMNGFRNSEQKRMGNFFKEVFLGSDKLDTDKAFNLFLTAPR